MIWLYVEASHRLSSKRRTKIHQNAEQYLNNMPKTIHPFSSAGKQIMTTYLPRIADTILQKKLSYTGAVLIEGPKWCGKTTTAEQAAGSMLYMSDPQNAAMASLDVHRLLVGATPRLLDEWQVAPELWDAVRFTVDHREGFGQFILTGSAVPADTHAIFHTGTGRFSSLKMRPMSLFESRDSTGEVSLAALFSQPDMITGTSSHTFTEISYLICRGGWPKAVGMPKNAALETAYDYLDAIVNSDISRVDNVSRKPERVRALMRSYARFQGTSAANTELKKDLVSNDSVVCQRGKNTSSRRLQYLHTSMPMRSYVRAARCP